MIPKDLLEDWRHYEVTKRVIAAMQKEKDALTESMQLGHFVNTEDMEATFGMCSKAVGTIAGLNTFFDIIEGRMEDED